MKDSKSKNNSTNKQENDQKDETETENNEDQDITKDWRYLRIQESQNMVEKMLQNMAEYSTEDNLTGLLSTIEFIFPLFLNFCKSQMAYSRLLINTTNSIISEFLDLPQNLQQSKKTTGLKNNQEFDKNMSQKMSTTISFIIKNYLIQYDIMEQGISIKYQEPLKNILKEFKDSALNRYQASVTSLETVKSCLKCCQTSLKNFKSKNSESIDTQEMEFPSSPNGPQDTSEGNGNSQIFKKELESISNEIISVLRLSEALVKSNSNMAPMILDSSVSALAQSFIVLESLFQELNSHCEIQQNFQSMLEDPEKEMINTLKKDTVTQRIFEASQTILPENQLIFVPEIELNTFYTASFKIQKNWKNNFVQFLKENASYYRLTSDNLLESELPIDKKIKEADLPSDNAVTQQFESVLELTSMDLSLACSYTFKSRITKNNIPYNGQLCLTLDCILFYSSGMLGKIALLIPFFDIIDVKSKSNFFGMSNGVALETSKGTLEFYLDNKTVREVFSRKTLNLIEMAKVSAESTLRKLTSFQDHQILREQGILIKTKLTTLQIQEAEKKVKRIQKKVMLGYFNQDSKIYEGSIQDSSIRDTLDLIFGGRAVEWDNQTIPNFLFNWRSSKGATNIEMTGILVVPKYLKDETTMPSIFLSMEDQEDFLTHYEVNNQKIKEKLRVYWVQIDQIIINISLTSSSRLELDLTILIVQKEDKLEIYGYWKQGLIPSPQLSTLYGHEFFKEIEQWMEQLRLLNKSEKADSNEEDLEESIRLKFIK